MARRFALKDREDAVTYGPVELLLEDSELGEMATIEISWGLARDIHVKVLRHDEAVCGSVKVEVV